LNSNEIKILNEINDSIAPEKIKKYQFKLYNIDEKKELANDIEFIKKFING
jgi:hypothetical protein